MSQFYNEDCIQKFINSEFTIHKQHTHVVSKSVIDVCKLGLVECRTKIAY